MKSDGLSNIRRINRRVNNSVMIKYQDLNSVEL